MIYSAASQGLLAMLAVLFLMARIYERAIDGSHGVFLVMRSV